MFHALSEEYAQNSVVCLPQDLHTFYVYWDFTGLRNQIVNKFLQMVKPKYQLNVRLCRWDPESQQFVAQCEVVLQQIETGNYYFNNLNPVDTYCFEIGAKLPEGGFICFYQTPPVRMQPAGEAVRQTRSATKFGLTDPDRKTALERTITVQNQQQLTALSSFGLR